MPFDTQGALQAGAQPGDIATFLASKVPNFDIAGARKAGASDQDIIGFLASKVDGAPSAPLDPTAAGSWDGTVPGPDGSVPLDPQQSSAVYHAVTPAAVQRGVAYTGNGVASTLDVLGAKGAGDVVRSHVDQAQASQASSMSAVGHDIAAGNYGRALSEVPSAIMEGLPAALPAIGAAALTDGAAIPVMAAGAATSAATQGGDLAKARAAANGRPDAPTAADAALGIGGAAALGAVGTVGLGEAAPGVVGAIKQAAIHGAADVGQALGNQAVATAGTSQGLTLDPSQAAAQALIGAGTRAGMSVAGRVQDQLDGTTAQNAQDALVAKYQAMAPGDQQRLQDVVAASQALQGVQDGAVPSMGAPRPATAAAQTVTDALARSVTGTARALLQSQAIDGAGSGVIGAALENARNPNRILGNDDLDAIRGLGLDDAKTNALTSALSQVQLLSDAGSTPSGSGMGGLLPSIAGRALGHAVGGPVGHLLGPILARAAYQKALSAGSGVPSLVSDGGRYGDMLNAAGVTVSDPRAALASAAAIPNDPVAQQRRLMGSPADGTTSPSDTPAAPTGPGAATMMPTQGDAALAPTMAASASPATPQDPIASAQVQTILGSGAMQPSAGPAASQDPISVAQLRGDIASALPSFNAPSGLPADAMAMAARLPAWQFGIGASLQDALHRSGTPSPVNFSKEATQSVRDLVARGWLPSDLGQQVLAHPGTLAPQLYELVRNETLMRHGIDRTHSPGALGVSAN